MTWLVDLDEHAASRAVVRALRAADPRTEVVRAPRAEPSGLVLCSRESAALDELLSATAGAGWHVIVVAVEKGLEPWSVLARGAADVLTWDGDPEAVLARVARAREVDELVRAPQVSATLRGSSPALAAALRDLVTAARFARGPILILGETGTGKELAARVAHRMESGSGPLVVVDCTTVVPSLSGSELFGHEKGAFTGAVNVRIGACAAANGGTLMLDEVGELPLELQSELLRVVQEGTYKRVGSDTWHTTRFRLVCATNRDLAEEVRAGRFRADLYHRIAASTVRMPPLRDRPEDVVPLFTAFVAEAEGRREPVRLTSWVERAVRARAYPGNLRDLRQLAQRVAARHVGPGPVTPGDLPPADRPDRAGPAVSAEPDEDRDLGTLLARVVRVHLAAGTNLRDLRERVAEVAVDAALSEAGGNVRAAAVRLGVTDRALHHRLAEARKRTAVS
ncbi:sigma-54-dependent transcriptional regulator [Umezawaea endophytica]|uniref:Sigma 54-interacting transcriptional regulator n=1 Tax=Umezawaea endophytica TaxID=1654476 RepID=A0A9X2VJJ3_9PSEU|nr:sigma 54-interacting transcriptional regulator [Umezawaea endophytica]MCS7477771.1 sigma 54-interacting transcriptional regulator [Umezawaea endophytica]